MSDAEPARPVPAPLRQAICCCVSYRRSCWRRWRSASPISAAGSFAVFWGIAAIIVMWEWTTLVSGADRRSVLMTGIVVVALAVILAASSAGASDDLRDLRFAAAAIVLVMGMLARAAIAPRQRASWLAAGVPYAGAMALAPIVLRSDAEFGFVAMIFCSRSFGRRISRRISSAAPWAVPSSRRASARTRPGRVPSVASRARFWRRCWWCTSAASAASLPRSWWLSRCRSVAQIGDLVRIRDQAPVRR